MRKIVLLTSHGGWAPWTGMPPEAAADREEPFRLLRKQGIETIRIDPGRRPWNPFGRSHPVLAAIDPLRALRVMIGHRDADAVLCCYESSSLALLLLRRMFRFRARIAIYDIGGADGWRLRDAILRMAVPRADLLLPLANVQVARLERLGAKPGAVRPTGDSTSTRFYAVADDMPDGYVLAVGDDVSRDYGTLLEAAPAIRRRIVIRTNLLDGRTDLPENVTVERRRLDSREYRDLIAGACVVTVPVKRTEHPGGITTLLEAMSSGKAVVATDSPGIADHAIDGENCAVARCGDADALTRLVNDMLDDGPRRRALGQRARRWVETHASAETDARRFARDLLDIEMR